MDLDFYILRLAENAGTIKSLVNNLSDEPARWKAASDQWSILQIIFHLLQTEDKDFRPRLEKILRNPAESWIQLEPREMRLEREDENGDFKNFLQEFLLQRENSVAWLKTIENPEFGNTHQNEQTKLSAGDLLASWLAHDFLHIKQIIRAHYDYVNHVSQPYQTDYAGKWT